MMATDHSREGNGGRYPSRATLDLLRASLARYLSGEIDDEQVCHALDVLAREAQDRQLHGEHMLLAFKDAWHDMPEVERIRDPSERRRLLEHLVKLCIDAYYKR
jgi:hypothetical protein